MNPQFVDAVPGGNPLSRPAEFVAQEGEPSSRDHVHFLKAFALVFLSSKSQSTTGAVPSRS